MSEPGGVFAMAFSRHDGALVTVDRATGRVTRWAPHTGAIVSRVLSGGQVSAPVALSGDGRYLLLRAPGQQQRMELWDTVAGAPIRELSDLQGMTAAAVSVHGAVATDCRPEPCIQLWDRTGKRRRVVDTSHASWTKLDSARPLSFSPDGTRLALLGRWDEVRVVSLPGGELQLDESGPLLAWSADGDILARGSHVCFAQRLGGGPPIEPVVMHHEEVRQTALALSPQGTMVAAGGPQGSVRLWQLGRKSSRREVSLGRADMTSVVFSDDGQWLAAASADQGSIGLWRVPELRPARAGAQHDGAVEQVSISADGAHLATVDAARNVRVWDVASGTQLGRIDNGKVAALTADGRMLLTSAAEGGVVGWKLQPVRQVFHTAEVAGEALTVSPDGRVVAAASGEGALDVVHLPSGHALRRLRVAALDSNLLAFSPSGALLAGEGPSRSIKIWDRFGELQAEHDYSEADAPEAVAFVSEQALLEVTRSGSVQLWDLGAGQSPTPLSLPCRPPMAFSHAAGLLACQRPATDQPTETAAVVVVLEYPSEAVRARFAGHGGPLVDLAFSSDGSRLASGSSDGTAIVWSVPDAATEGEP